MEESKCVIVSVKFGIPESGFLENTIQLGFKNGATNGDINADKLINDISHLMVGMLFELKELGIDVKDVTLNFRKNI